jgi:manganese/zinc/iron transport system permease protein
MYQLDLQLSSHSADASSPHYWSLAGRSMIIIHLQLIIITVLLCAACALPGILLVLRGTAMMSDAISHALLPGIAISFLYTQQIQSPLLMVGATISGIFTVLIVESIIQSRKLNKDAAIGIIYPLFFSVGVLIINQAARNIHLDTDIVLLGELALAPLNRLTLSGIDLGPYALYTSAALFACNGICFWMLRKEYILSTIDPVYAYTLGFRPAMLHHILMIMTSITAVTAFDSVGSIMVIALMITPAATACLMSHTTMSVVAYTLGISTTCGCIGYLIAYVSDVSISGAIASTTGFLFFLTVAQQFFGLRKKI